MSISLSESVIEMPYEKSAIGAALYAAVFRLKKGAGTTLAHRSQQAEIIEAILTFT